MSEDGNDGENGEMPQPKAGSLSDETVEEAKKEILRGVGYKRPPESTRFRKGQSGNPKGRPRHDVAGIGDSRSTNSLVLKEAERLIAIREGEERKQICAIEAVHRAQYASATRGNAYSQKHIIERYDRAERERRRQMMEDIELAERYVAARRKEMAEAEHKGEPPPNPLPHPDDVVIDHEQGVWFIGPVDETELARVEEILNARDVLIIQDALDRREADGPDRDDPLNGPGTALVFAILLNRSVPQRYRLSDMDFISRTTQYDAVPKRDLIKRLYRAWRTIGLQPDRGSTMPPLRVAKQVIDHMAELSGGTADRGDTNQP